jgi:sec-independent protein translocase protein TatC
MASDTKLPLIEHLLELRRRLMWSAIAVVITTAFSFVFADRIIKMLLRPAGNIKTVFTEMQEMFSVYIKVSLVSGIALAMPFIIYQLVMFVAPALTPREKRFLYSVLPGVIVSFAVGAAFGYFILLPPAIGFLLTFGSDIATPFIKIGNYISVVTTLLFWIGICFELPVVLWFLARLGIISPQRLSKSRPFAFVAAFILGAAVTPTSDPLNQTLVAAPLIILYEIGILLSKLAWRSKKTASAK